MWKLRQAGLFCAVRFRSFAERDDAELAAWNVPGVIKVESHLEIEEPEYVFEE
jgi:hypothetical protein